jgi:AAA domain
MMALDQNEKLLAGQLPDDPFDGAEPITAPVAPPPPPSMPNPSSSPVAQEPPITSYFQDARSFLVDTQDEGVEFLVEGLLPAMELTIAAGLPDCMKSWVTLALGLSVATGEPFLGVHKVNSPGRVALICEDDPAGELRRRIWWLARGLNCDPRDLPLQLMCRRSMYLDDPTKVAALAGWVERNEVRLLILDPLARMHDVDENDATSMKPVVEALRRLGRLTTVIVVAHYRKNAGGKQSRPGQLVRGSSDLWAAGRTVLGFERKGDAILLSPACHYLPSAEPLRLRFMEEQHDADSKRGRFVLAGPTTPAGQPDGNSLEGQILAAIRGGGSLTTTEVRERVHGAHEKIEAALMSLEAAKTISGSTESRQDKKGRRRRVKVWRLSGDAAEPSIPDEDSLPEEADEEDDS